MRVLDPSNSLLSFWQHLVFTEAALLAHPDTAALAPPFTELLDAFQSLHGGDLATRRGVLQAQARSVIADQDVDEGLRRLHSDALNAVTQDREHAIFTSLFPSNIALTIRFALARQLEVTQKVLTNLELTIMPASLKAHIAKLQALVAAGMTVLEGKKQAAFARTEATLSARAWKDDVNAIRLSTYGLLLGIAAKQRRPKSWVEAFYMQRAEARDSIDVDTDDADTPVEPEPPADA